MGSTDEQFARLREMDAMNPEERANAEAAEVKVSERTAHATTGSMIPMVLAIIGVLGAAIGILSLTQATLGVGIIGVGCFFGILARLVQAADHQNQTKKLLADLAAQGKLE